MDIMGSCVKELDTDSYILALHASAEPCYHRFLYLQEQTALGYHALNSGALHVTFTVP